MLSPPMMISNSSRRFCACSSSVVAFATAGCSSPRLTVSNRGPALSEAARRKVWDRFYSTRTEAGGSGLGLAIVRSVALAHGGSVGVHCAGGVTSFWIELPRST